MKKCILFVFWVMLFLLLGPQPLQVGNTNKCSIMRIGIFAQVFLQIERGCHEWKKIIKN